ncbi:RNA 2',3'-cyclic phosphodiesterase [Spartinivicinus ruber]|uniref:RNA 2',3'-cyclic phosphodiesterase n=1 Tax=Spartinivicinus ruber TaxID=2683272 RepID=UPI0013D69294|nr:RNA 2',3'-cyclic phosphodiesterase [Spartinivicinus ruber]
MGTANQPEHTTDTTDSQPIRVFIGIPIATDLAETIFHYYQGAFSEAFISKNLRWTKLEHFHITLKFIAALDSGVVESLASHLTQLIAEQTCFSCQLKDLHWFPNKNRARLLALSVSSKGILPALALKVDQLCQQWQIPKETRPFRPHLTLARLKKTMHTKKVLPVGLTQLFEVNEVKLFQSTVDNMGSHYKALATFPLAHG